MDVTDHSFSSSMLPPVNTSSETARLNIPQQASGIIHAAIEAMDSSTTETKLKFDNVQQPSSSLVASNAGTSTSNRLVANPSSDVSGLPVVVAAKLEKKESRSVECQTDAAWESDTESEETSDDEDCSDDSSASENESSTSRNPPAGVTDGVSAAMRSSLNTSVTEKISTVDVRQVPSSETEGGLRKEDEDGRREGAAGESTAVRSKVTGPTDVPDRYEPSRVIVSCSSERKSDGKQGEDVVVGSNVSSHQPYVVNDSPPDCQRLEEPPAPRYPPPSVSRSTAAYCLNDQTPDVAQREEKEEERGMMMQGVEEFVVRPQCAVTVASNGCINSSETGVDRLEYQVFTREPPRGQEQMFGEDSEGFVEDAYAGDGYGYVTDASRGGDRGLMSCGAMESPISLNSSVMSVSSNADINCGNIVQQPQGNNTVYADCAQYGMCAGPGGGNGRELYPGVGSHIGMTSQMTSPATDCSQLTSPLSNHSYQMAGQSPAVMNCVAGGYVNGEHVDNQSPTVGRTTFKMPNDQNGCEEARHTYAATGGFGVAVASPVGQNGFGGVGAYVDHSPSGGGTAGGQFNAMNQNSPNNINGGAGGGCIVYNNMPTPSPTNSSSRSFNMASPSSYLAQQSQQQQQTTQLFDRSCPSAPALSYSRVLPSQQQITSGLTLNDGRSCVAMPPGSHLWPQTVYDADGYSLIQFQDNPMSGGHSGGLAMSVGGHTGGGSMIGIEEGHQQLILRSQCLPTTAQATKSSKSSSSSASSRHHRRGTTNGKIAKGTAGVSPSRSQSVAPNVTIQPGTNMITGYNVLSMNSSIGGGGGGGEIPEYCQYPANNYMAAVANTAAFVNQAAVAAAGGAQRHGINIYHQHQGGAFPSAGQQSHHGGMYATYGYINSALAAQQSLNHIMRQ